MLGMLRLGVFFMALMTRGYTTEEHYETVPTPTSTLVGLVNGTVGAALPPGISQRWVTHAHAHQHVSVRGALTVTDSVTTTLHLKSFTKATVTVTRSWTQACRWKATGVFAGCRVRVLYVVRGQMPGHKVLMLADFKDTPKGWSDLSAQHIETAEQKGAGLAKAHKPRHVKAAKAAKVKGKRTTTVLTLAKKHRLVKPPVSPTHKAKLQPKVRATRAHVVARVLNRLAKWSHTPHLVKRLSHRKGTISTHHVTHQATHHVTRHTVHHTHR